MSCKLYLAAITLSIAVALSAALSAESYFDVGMTAKINGIGAHMPCTKTASDADVVKEMMDRNRIPISSDTRFAKTTEGALFLWTGTTILGRDRVVVAVNQAGAKTRQRFTIAHELGTSSCTRAGHCS